MPSVVALVAVLARYPPYFVAARAPLPGAVRRPARVPATVVLPVAAVTLNLLVLTDRLPVTAAVPERVVAPVTDSVPPTAVLPLAAVMLNLLVFTATEPATFSVLESVVAPLAASVPATLVLPFAAAAVNLLAPTVRSPLVVSVPTLALPFVRKIVPSGSTWIAVPVSITVNP